MKDLIKKAGIMVEMLPYIQKFRDAIVVVKFGGSAMEDSELTKKTMRDIVLLEAVGMKVVVVHGGGKAITAKLAEMKIPTEFIHGFRKTCDDTISVVDDVLHDEVNLNLVQAVNDIGGRGEQISGKNILQAKKMYASCPETGDNVDVGHVGTIAEVDTDPIFEALKNNVIPVIPPLGSDGNGQVYNINADIAACNIAEALNAEKLVFVSDVPGILRDFTDESTLIPTIKVSEVPNLIKDKVIGGGMIPKVNASVHALQTGTKFVHMIDGRIEHSLLLEFFTDSGVGTMIING
ncbi:acetylglutamate kinase [Lentisphaerota bacterium WC36G]|nr:acetylglutamate kinase [Lentisphaerae bacterium WC36]